MSQVSLSELRAACWAFCSSQASKASVRKSITPAVKAPAETAPDITRPMWNSPTGGSGAVSQYFPARLGPSFSFIEPSDMLAMVNLMGIRYLDGVWVCQMKRGALNSGCRLQDNKTFG